MTGVVVAGAARTKFGRSELSGRDHAIAAVRSALADAGIGWSRVRAAFGGSDSAGLADTLVTDLGLTGLPFVNVKNGCATGGSALVSAVNAIVSGMADVVVAVGFDKHPAGAFDPRPEDWGLPACYGADGLMVTTQFFGAKIQRYLHDHDIDPSVLGAVAEKAYRNGALNPQAWRRTAMSAAEIQSSGMVSDPLTRFMFCSPGEGAAALVLTSDNVLPSRHRTVRLDSVAVRSRTFGSFEVFAPWIPGGELSSVSRDASAAAFESAGIGPEDVRVAQLQDTEAGAELMHMAECGFCPDGDQEKWISQGMTEIDGVLPVNTDGGCIANGEPIGASGLRQVVEVVLQLRGEAGDRQVPGAPGVGFTHVYGAPGVSACAVLSC
jgi:acetyl-CoA acetyltransferase